MIVLTDESIWYYTSKLSVLHGSPSHFQKAGFLSYHKSPVIVGKISVVLPVSKDGYFLSKGKEIERICKRFK